MVLETWGQPGIDDIERPRAHRPAYVVVIEPGADGLARLDDPPTWAGRIGMHIRGNSTAEEYPKKQYKLELWDEFDRDLPRPMLGMPAEADWVLHAPHSDKTFMRNHLVYRWSNRIGRRAARTRFVEAMIDRGDTLDARDYVGVYVWMDKIEVGPNRVDVTALEPEDADDHENPEFPADNPQGYLWYERLFEDPAFVARYAERWRELRAGALATDALLADIDEAAALLQRARHAQLRAVADSRTLCVAERRWPRTSWQLRRGSRLPPAVVARSLGMDGRPARHRRLKLGARGTEPQRRRSPLCYEFG